jgi:5-carboxymethyl-2-hydroxymuconate isomerase
LQPLVQNADRVPHNLKVYNLSAIKNRGIEAWAAETGEIRKRYFAGSFKIGAGPQLAEEK